MRQECYIRFRATVNSLTTNKLLGLLDDKYKNGYSKIHLLISSPGGSVKDGIDIYNFIKMLPIEINTYNFGSVDSIGVIIYCSGNKKLSVANARFLLHPVTGMIPQNTRIDEHLVRENLKSLEIDQNNIAKIIGITTQKDYKDVMDKIHARTTFSPEEAKDYNLVDEIIAEKIPTGKEIISINDIEQQQHFQQPIPINIPMNSTSMYDKNIML